MIYVLAGHHNRDSGAVNKEGVKESVITKLFRDKVVSHLRSWGIPFIIDNDNETLAQVTKRIKPGTGSVLCEFHLNASDRVDAKGTEVFVKDGPKPSEKALAADIAHAISTHCNIYNRGVKTESQSPRKKLAILHTEAGISVLVELCFITNKEDMRLFRLGMDSLAERIAELLIKYDAIQS